MNQQDTNNQSVIIEDLSAQNAEDVKGGPKKIFIGGLSVQETAAVLPDLELRGEVKGGICMLLPAVQKVR